MSRAIRSRTAPTPGRPRLWIDLLLLAVAGVVIGALGPFRTLDVGFARRTAYWLIAVMGAGLVGVLVDRFVQPQVRNFIARTLTVSVLMTPPVTAFIYLLNLVMLGLPNRPWLMPELAGQVFAIALLVMTLRGLAWRRVVETRTIVAPPLPEAEAAFRRRLSARRRTARLIAVEAEDHYVRAHTDQGAELILMRFSEALDELALAHGHRLHRSWWVAADALERIRWRRGGGEATLAGGLTAPVSRSYVADLRAAGW